jgi:hypothetical protein
MAISPLNPEAIRPGTLHRTGSLGPSDSSDSGSDLQGVEGFDPSLGEDSGADSGGTGERAWADGTQDPVGLDIAPDHVVSHPDQRLEADELGDPDADPGEGEARPVDLVRTANDLQEGRFPGEAPQEEAAGDDPAPGDQPAPRTGREADPAARAHGPR